MRGRLFVAFAFVVAVAAVMQAQEKPATPIPAKIAEIAAALADAPKAEVAPAVSELVALRFDNFLAEMDKRTLAVRAAQAESALAQAELEKIKSDAQAFALAQQRPGYTLARGRGGKWVYVQQEPKPAAAPEKK